MAIELDDNEQKVLKQILLRMWFDHSSLSFKEQLQMHDPQPSEEFVEDVITDLTKKVGITPEETW